MQSACRVLWRAWLSTMFLRGIACSQWPSLHLAQHIPALTPGFLFPHNQQASNINSNCALRWSSILLFSVIHLEPVQKHFNYVTHLCNLGALSVSFFTDLEGTASTSSLFPSLVRRWYTECLTHPGTAWRGKGCPLPFQFALQEIVTTW